MHDIGLETLTKKSIFFKNYGRELHLFGEVFDDSFDKIFYKMTEKSLETIRNQLEHNSIPVFNDIDERKVIGHSNVAKIITRPEGIKALVADFIFYKKDQNTQDLFKSFSLTCSISGTVRYNDCSFIVNKKTNASVRTINNMDVKYVVFKA